jgi:lipoprotein-releasing system permease protein
LTYQLFIALRYLRAKHKQAFTSVITVISIIGIAIGVMALVVALSLMSGMHGQIRDNILGSRSHVTLHGGKGEKVINNYREVREQILAIDGVLGAAPLVREEGLLQTIWGEAAVRVFGVDPAESQEVINVFDHLIEGDWHDLKKLDTEFSRHGVLVGYELAQTVGLQMGDTVKVMTTTSTGFSPAGVSRRTLHGNVVGIFKTGDWMADSNYIYMPLSYMQQKQELGNGITKMQVKIEDVQRAGEVRDAIRAKVGDRFLYSTWIEENQGFMDALALEKLAMFLTISLIIAVAALNIISSLIMLVMEKNRDIGILRSMGASSSGIMSTFVLQGLIIGLIGTISGAVIGTSLSAFLDYYEIVKLPGDVYMISTVQFKLVPSDIFLVSAVALAISLLATIYPAWKASRLRPAEALRYE